MDWTDVVYEGFTLKQRPTKLPRDQLVDNGVVFQCAYVESLAMSAVVEGSVAELQQSLPLR